MAASARQKHGRYQPDSNNGENVEPDRKHKYPTPIAKKRSFNLDGRTSDLSTLHFASHWMIDPFANTE